MNDFGFQKEKEIENQEKVNSSIQFIFNYISILFIAMVKNINIHLINDMNL